MTIYKIRWKYGNSEHEMSNYLTNPLLEKKGNRLHNSANSVVERNKEKKNLGKIIGGHLPIDPSAMGAPSKLDDWDYLLNGVGEDEKEVDNQEGSDTNDKTKCNICNNQRISARFCLILMFIGGLIMTASSCVCAVYVGLTYQDVHSSYLSMQNFPPISLKGFNETDIEYMKLQMRSINHCISERYCKRLKNEENNEEKEVEEL